MEVKFYRLSFKTTSPGTIPRFSGGLVRGMFFKALKETDKHLATEIHDSDMIKRFALSQFTIDGPSDETKIQDKKDNTSAESTENGETSHPTPPDDKTSINSILSTMGRTFGEAEPTQPTASSTLNTGDNPQNQRNRRLTNRRNTGTRNNRRTPRDTMLNVGDSVHFDIATTDDKILNAVNQIMSIDWEADKDALRLEPHGIHPLDTSPITHLTLENPLKIRFQTPLSFSNGDGYFFWPEPSYIMKNLLTIWNNWLPNSQLDPETIEPHVNNVSVEYAKGNIIRVQTGKKMIHRGWIGDVSFYSRDESSHQMLSYLIKLGFFTGVGRARTSGLGRFYFPRIIHQNLLVPIKS